MESVKVIDFKDGNKIEGYYLIKSVDCKITNSNNRKYLDFMLCDNTGEVNAKLWEVKNDIDKEFQSNTIVHVRGAVLAWQGSHQLKIERIRNLDEQDKVDINDYVISAPYSSEEMYDTIVSHISKFTNKDIKNIVEYILEENKEKLMYHPAAKRNHHAIRGGLLYHTVTMLKAAEKMCDLYEYLNKDLLYAGVILHDIAKINEMNANELGIVKEYTVEGSLIGHISIGSANIAIVGDALGASKEVVMLLQHMILSHHYEPEFGSPIKPMIVEAEMLHYLDILDARMYDMKKALNETEEGKFSDRIFALENRRIYKPRLE